MTAMESLATPPAASRAPDPALGFVGLGRMGFAFAQRLVRAGFPLIVWNRTQAKVEPLVAEGARWSRTPKDMAKSIGMGVVFLSLTDGAAVKRVLFGRSGLSRGAPAGALIVDLSTIDPEESRTFAARLEEKGIHYLDAPVAGSVDAATSGEASFYVGGKESDIARVRPVLEKMGRRVDAMGPVGSGASMKLVNNLLTVGITVLSTEALSLADGFQLDRARTVEALLSGGGRSAMLERKAPAFLARHYPAQFTTVLARKDLKLIERAAAREGRPLKMIREARRLLDEAIAQGRGEEDFSAVFEAVLARSRSKLGGFAAPATVKPESAPTGVGPNSG